MNQAKLSVIIPVYNTEAYLRQCLDSVINQTLSEIEIICVNDGSTDNSLNILKEYASSDNRIKIIDTPNGGQGSARNLAITQATGEYLGFVDSDDWVDPHMFQHLYGSALKLDADVTLCEFQHVDEDNGILPQTAWLKLPMDHTFDHRSFRWEDIHAIGFQINSGPVNKIYKRHFVIHHHIQFATSLYYEDILFVFICLIKAEKISIVRKPLYFYRYTRPDATSADKGKKQFEIFTVLALLKEAIKDDPKFDFLKADFIRYQFNQFFFHCTEIHSAYKNEFWSRIKSEFNSLDEQSRKMCPMCDLTLRMGMKMGLFFYQGLKYSTMVLNSLKKNVKIRKAVVKLM